MERGSKGPSSCSITTEMMFGNYRPPEPDPPSKPIHERCSDCGWSYKAEFDHKCNLENLINYQMAILEREIREHMDSAEGQFDIWYWEHRR